MIVGIPKEIKVHEYRVGITHHGVREFILKKHKVLVEKGAGIGAGITDEMYKEAGAELVERSEVFQKAEMIMKVKEPQPSEYNLLQKGQILFTYLHLAAEKKLTQALVDSDCVAIAYETITDSKGGLPLLAPMSLIAGRMSVQAGAFYLQKVFGGKGRLLSGAPGVKNGKVVIIGGGAVGMNAARIALGMGAQVCVFDRSNRRLFEIDELYGNSIRTFYSTEESLNEQIRDADVIIGAVLVPGASAPKVIHRNMLGQMEAGSVLVDVSIDQGGCFETSVATTHENPVFDVDGIVHYCVANMPGAVASTSTYALTNSTLPYALKIADQGWKSALRNDLDFQKGLNVCNKKITHQAVASAFDSDYFPAKECIEAS